MGSDCNKEKIRCMHSKEAVSMLLSHAPHRLSIKEIAGITNYHRNTVRPAIKELLAEGKINSMGDGNNTIYFLDSITDHYRRIARTIYSVQLDHLTDNMKLDLIRQLGYKMVKNSLEELEIKADQTKLNHDSLVEALVHVKMAYPFTDLMHQSKESGHGTVVRSALRFDLVDEEFEPDDFNLHISPCLCGGDETQFFACEMVAGALEGAIQGACDVSAKVRRVGGGSNPEYGKYCTYNIVSNDTKEFDNDPIVVSQENRT